MHITQTERLLHDPGEVGLGVRLMMTPLGLMGIYCAVVLAVRGSIIGASLFAIFGILMLAVWLPRTQGRLFFDSANRQLIVRGMLGSSWRHSLSGAQAVVIDEVHDAGGMFGGGSWVEIGLRYQGGREVPITNQPLGDPKHVAAKISEAVGLPITKK